MTKAVPRHGTSLLVLLLVIGVMSACAILVGSSLTKTRAAGPAKLMKFELRKLAELQLEYFRVHGRFAGSIGMGGSLPSFHFAQPIQIVDDIDADSLGWTMSVRHSGRPGVACSVAAGNRVRAGETASVPHCF